MLGVTLAISKYVWRGMVEYQPDADDYFMAGLVVFLIFVGGFLIWALGVFPFVVEGSIK